ncbi:MAG: crossover junction endodeoxyribonuclease RuvC [Actinomycetes bacterium]|jgi:crossover junction endodeoxyribonuclease RuvC|nr:crossover junction endodeoxyribonuclease RuvC [Actinomycetes bacterium]
MRVLGIDPGLVHTGWGVIDSSGASTSRAVAYGVIDTRSSDPLSTRLDAIYSGIVSVIERYRPDAAALESVYFGLNAKTALSLGQARAAAILATARRGLTLGEYPPATIKNVVVGQGRAEKEQVAYMVRMLLGLDHEPHPDHASDALAAAITHLTMTRVVA